MKFGRARKHWSREFDLSSGRRVRVDLHPSLSWALQKGDVAVSPLGVVWPSRALTEGEQFELEQLLNRDELVVRMRGGEGLPPRAPFRDEVRT